MQKSPRLQFCQAQGSRCSRQEQVQDQVGRFCTCLLPRLAAGAFKTGAGVFCSASMGGLVLATCAAHSLTFRNAHDKRRASKAAADTVDPGSKGESWPRPCVAPLIAAIHDLLETCATLRQMKPQVLKFLPARLSVLCDSVSDCALPQTAPGAPGMCVLRLSRSARPVWPHGYLCGRRSS